jgi:uncharacterized protein YggE
MKKALLIILGLVMVLATIGVAGCSDYFGSGEDTTSYSINSNQSVGIWVTGVGSVTAVPDTAILVMGVSVQQETVAAAQEQAAAAMAAVMDVLDDYDIDEADIQTSQYSIYPVYDWSEDKQTIVGYQVTNTINVTIHSIDDTAGIIDDTVAATGDDIRISSIGFTVEDADAYYEDARELAMEDAKEKAEQLADLADVKLGKAFYVSESSGNTSLVVYRDYAAEDASPASVQTSISPANWKSR